MKKQFSFAALIDLAEYNLPLLDEPIPASFNQYSHDLARRWSAKISSFDGYVFITPDYNHSIPAALKNSQDFLYNEFHNKAAGFIGYAAAVAVGAFEI